MSRPRGLPKTGGRPAGGANRATRAFRAFLQGIFREALLDSPEARLALVAAIKTFTLEPRQLQLLLAYAYGAPPRELDVTHRGNVSLAQLVSGSALDTVTEDEDEFDDEEVDDPPPPNGSPQS